MTTRDKDGFRKARATATGGKGLFLALALAGAGFQGCTTEDKATSPGGAGPGSGSEDGFAAFQVDSARQAADEKGVDHQSGSPKDLVTTPFGKVERRCVYELGEGESVQDESTVMTRTGMLKSLDGTGCGTPDRTGNALAKSGPYGTDGWVMAGWWDFMDRAKELVSDFTVPRDPASAGAQVLFFFSSFLTAGAPGERWIVQPVLEYGKNGGYGGHYWLMGGWIVKGYGSVHYNSKPVRVYAGDKLRGKIQGKRCTAEGRCTWTVTMQNLTRHTSSTLASNVRLPPMVTVQGGVMEAYDVTFCTDYPAQTHLDFTGIKVWDVDDANRQSDWEAKVWPHQFPDCGFKVTVRQGISSGVGLHWNPNKLL